MNNFFWWGGGLYFQQRHTTIFIRDFHVLLVNYIECKP